MIQLFKTGLKYYKKKQEWQIFLTEKNVEIDWLIEKSNRVNPMWRPRWSLSNNLLRSKKKKLNFWSNTTKQPTLHSEAVEGGWAAVEKSWITTLKNLCLQWKWKWKWKWKRRRKRKDLGCVCKHHACKKL